MQITLKKAAVAAVAAGACAGALMFASAGSAASGYTVTPGGKITVAQSGQLVFKDITATSAPQLTCKTFAGSGTAKKGAHKYVPAKLPKSTKGLDAAATLTQSTLKFGGCSNGVAGTTTIKPAASWNLGLSKKTKSGGTGYLYNVTANVSAAGCTFTSTGAVYGTYSNKTGLFSGTKTAGLVLSKVKGSVCGLVGIANGDKAYLNGKVAVKPKLSIK